MADVFISYKKEDYQAAERVIAALRAEGLSGWWDDSLTAKSGWDAELEREIAAGATVVVLWTPRSVESEWVRTEAHYAHDRGKLVPVMLESCTIPIAFLLRQTVNLSQWRGDRDDRNWRKLLTWVADLSATKLGNANIPQALGAAQPNRFREVIGQLPSGDPIVDGAFVNASTPPAPHSATARLGRSCASCRRARSWSARRQPTPTTAHSKDRRSAWKFPPRSRSESFRSSSRSTRG